MGVDHCCAWDTLLNPVRNHSAFVMFQMETTNDSVSGTTVDVSAVLLTPESLFSCLVQLIQRLLLTRA